MKRLTFLILSLLMICSSLVMSSITDSGPPGVDVISIEYQLPQTLNALETQEFVTPVCIGEITIYRSNLTNWPSLNESLYTRDKLRGITIKTIIEILGIDASKVNIVNISLKTNQFYIPVNKHGIAGREVCFRQSSYSLWI